MKRLLVFAAILALAVFVGMIAPSLARETSSIHGSVVDSRNNRPLQSVSVAAYGARGREAVFSTFTGKDGAFRISGLAGGAYRLTISAHGYQEEVVTGISLRPDEHLIISGPIALRRASMISQSGVIRNATCNTVVHPGQTGDVYVVCAGR